MRKRKIKKIGSSWYIKLEQADIKEWELKEGDLIGIKKLGEKSNEYKNL